MSRLEISVCILLFSVFISSVSQILLKKAADRTYESSLKEYLNPLVIGAYGMFFCDPHDAGTEVCTAFHVTNSGINRIYFCIGDGIFFLEREIYQKKACGICTDSGRRYYIQQDIEK